MHDIEYGFIGDDNKRYVGDKVSDVSMDEHYRLMQPAAVHTYRCGTCIDQSLYTYDTLTAMNFVCELRSIPVFGIGQHMYVIYRPHRLRPIRSPLWWFYFEHAFTKTKSTVYNETHADGVNGGIIHPDEEIPKQIINVMTDGKFSQMKKDTDYSITVVDRSTLIGDLDITKVLQLIGFNFETK